MAEGGQPLARLLSAQGFGTRQECRRLILAGQVALGTSLGDAPGGPGFPSGSGGSDGPISPLGPEPAGPLRWEPARDPDGTVSPAGRWFRVGDLELPYRETLHLAFHKPADCECSHAPAHHRSVFSFFPAPFLRRGLEAAGRLDADTTGLLLFSDSGAFIHRITSPKLHLEKTYRVEVKHPFTPDQITRIEGGVRLRSEDRDTLPARFEPITERRCLLTISEGRYHQVKRMFAAVGNRVESIHRVSIGPLALDAGLPEGAWRFLTDAEAASLAPEKP